MSAATTEPATESPLEPNLEFAQPADPKTIDRVAEALREKGYTVHIADDREAAKRLVVELVPEGAEVSQSSSFTLEELGITAEIEGSGRFDAVRPRVRSMDRMTPEGLRAMRKLGGTPDYCSTASMPSPRTARSSSPRTPAASSARSRSAPAR